MWVDMHDGAVVSNHAWCMVLLPSQANSEHQWANLKRTCTPEALPYLNRSKNSSNICSGLSRAYQSLHDIYTI